MADVAANINLSATGGSAAAAEIDLANQALERTVTSSGRLEGAFAHRFTHIGLQMFAGQALHASGLGAETRQVIGTLTLAVTSMASAFGSAGLPILLVTAGLTALVAIVIKLNEHTEKAKVDLDKVIKADEELIQKTDELLDPLEQYKNKIQVLPGYLEALYVAKKKLHDFQVANETEAIKLQNIELQKNIDNAQRVQDNFNKAVAISESFGHSVGDTNKLLHSNTEELLKNQAQLAENNAKLAIFSHGQDNVKKSIEDATKAIEKQAEERKKLQHAAEQAITKELEEFKKSHELQIQLIRKVDDQFGVATAKMIVEGESFTKAFQKFFQQMAEDVIAMIAKMIAEWLIFTELTEGFGVLPSHAAALTGFHAAAGGFDGTVNGPTLFLAGEAGPERVNIGPAGQQQGSNSLSVGNVYVTVTGVNDPKAIGDKVGQQIIQSIRGRGQLDFTR